VVMKSDWRIHLLVVLVALGAVLGSNKAAGASAAVIGDKTLVAWVSLADLTQRGGSVLTIEKPGGVFDAVVSENRLDGARRPRLLPGIVATLRNQSIGWSNPAGDMGSPERTPRKEVTSPRNTHAWTIRLRQCGAS